MVKEAKFMEGMLCEIASLQCVEANILFWDFLTNNGIVIIPHPSDLELCGYFSFPKMGKTMK